MGDAVARGGDGLVFALRDLLERWVAAPLRGLAGPQGMTGEPDELGRDPWPGDARRGEALLARRDELLRRLTETEVENVDDEWLVRLHGFDWLRDLRALGGDDARRLAREAVQTWIDHAQQLPSAVTRADVAGARVAAWVGNWSFFALRADDAFRIRMMTSLVRQARRLPGGWARAPAGSPRIAALHGLAVAGATFEGAERWIQQASTGLQRELAHQVLPDGGHIERSPGRQLAVLLRLVDVRALLVRRSMPVPERLRTAIEALAGMLRFYRHGDGGLALFNGSDEGDAGTIDLLLAQAGKTRATPTASDTGFERARAGKALLILDAGAPPPAGFDGNAHAGTLSFEFSVGRERLIVNCGHHDAPAPAWRVSSRATAAHSTVTIDDTNSSEISDGRIGRRARIVERDRREDTGSIWIDVAHDGYRLTHDIVHRRRLYLQDTGRDLRGEDAIEGPAGHRFQARFHLHPDVKASLVQEGSAVLLRLPSGNGWRFRATGGRVGLSESVYLGRRGEVRRTEQIVIEGETGEGGARLRWAIQAVERR